VKAWLWKGSACTWRVPMGQATGTSTTCPSGTGRLEQAVIVPVGQAQLVATGTGKGQKRPPLVPWDKSYTHAGGLSLSQDKFYTHDGACTSSICPKLSHKVGLQGRGKFKPESASSILQALSCRFVGCKCVIRLNSCSPKVKNPPKTAGAFT